MINIVSSKKYKELKSWVNKLEALYLEQVNSSLTLRIENLRLTKENDKLLKFHNDRLTKAKPDSKGILRNPNGTFAKKGN